MKDDAIKQKSMKMKQTVSDLQNQIRKEKENYEQQLIAKNEKIDFLKGDIAKMNVEFDGKSKEMKEAISTLKQQKQSIEREYESEKSKVLELEKDISSLRQQLLKFEQQKDPDSDINNNSDDA